jgi:hypothetical protein
MSILLVRSLHPDVVIVITVQADEGRSPERFYPLPWSGHWWACDCEVCGRQNDRFSKIR